MCFVLCAYTYYSIVSWLCVCVCDYIDVSNCVAVVNLFFCFLLFLIENIFVVFDLSDTPKRLSVFYRDESNVRVMVRC